MQRNSNRRSRGSIKPVTSRRNFVTRKQLHRELSGFRLKCGPDPSPIVVRPWKQQTLMMQGIGAKTVKDSTVVDGIQTQNMINLNKGAYICFRVRSAKVWIQNGISEDKKSDLNLQSPLNVFFHSSVGEGDSVQSADYGGEFAYASVGYMWPASQQSVVFTNVDTDQILTVFPVNVQAPWVVQLQVEWTTQLESQNSDTLDGVLASLCISHAT